MSRRLRVLAVCNMYPPLHMGGYELVCQEAVVELRRRGHDVAVLASEHRREEAPAGEAQVFRTLRWYPVAEPQVAQPLRERVAQARHNQAELARRLAAQRPDVVAWFAMGGLSLAMLDSVHRRGIPAVGFVDDFWFDYARSLDQWYRMFDRFPAAGALADRLRVPTGRHFRTSSSWAFNSRYMAETARAAGLAVDRIRVAPAGVDPVFYAPPSEPAWDWRLLVVGRLEARKGADVAVDALARLDPRARLHVVGSAEGEAEFVRGLREAIDRAGLAGRVTLADPLPAPALAEEYRRASAVLFPVRWQEPRGRVPLEAMASGTPVVATRTGGAADYLRDGENCLEVAIGSGEAVAGAVARLAAEPELRRRLQAGGFATAAGATVEAYADRVEAFLLEAVAAPTA